MNIILRCLTCKWSDPVAEHLKGEGGNRGWRRIHALNTVFIIARSVYHKNKLFILTFQTNKKNQLEKRNSMSIVNIKKRQDRITKFAFSSIDPIGI